jgi:hypothetical protein
MVQGKRCRRRIHSGISIGAYQHFSYSLQEEVILLRDGLLLLQMLHPEYCTV